MKGMRGGSGIPAMGKGKGPGGNAPGGRPAGNPGIPTGNCIIGAGIPAPAIPGIAPGKVGGTGRGSTGGGNPTGGIGAAITGRTGGAITLGNEGTAVVNSEVDEVVAEANWLSLLTELFWLRVDDSATSLTFPWVIHAGMVIPLPRPAIFFSFYIIICILFIYYTLSFQK
jgi:hypothetical protein